MIRKLLGLAVTLALPALLVAQTPPNPDEHASDTAQVKVDRHRQNPQVPAPEASDAARSKVPERRATQRRGEVVGLERRPTWIPVTPAQRAQPQGGGAATVALPPAIRPPQPALPVLPPPPAQKPESPGQSGSHRP